MALEEQLEELERAVVGRPMRWPWLLVGFGLLLILGLGIHAYTAYVTIARIDVNSKIATPNAVLLFQDLATNGPKVGSNVESASRATYSKALEQFVLDGTGVLLGIAAVVAGVFIRMNR